MFFLLVTKAVDERVGQDREQLGVVVCFFFVVVEVGEGFEVGFLD